MPEQTFCAITDAHWARLPTHPRLFAALRAPHDLVSEQLLLLLRYDAEKKLADESLVYPTQGFILFAVRQVQGRIITLSMMFCITRDRRYFERARDELLQLADLPNWCPEHFLDTAEAALAAGIGLDWLYDELAPSERDKIAHAIVNNALLPSLNAREGQNGWVDGDFNWNPVCHAGLTVGALAVAEREPELSRRIVERAIRNLPHAEATYAPHGSYPEGPSYWSYGTSFHVILVEALRSAFGTSCGIGSSLGFLQTAEFFLQMTGPTGEEFNFSDYHTENRHEPVMLWFARELRRRDLAAVELADLSRMVDAISSKDALPRSLSRHLAFEWLWWDDTLPIQKVALSRHWTAQGKLPIAVMRSSWDDPMATYVAIKGGTPNESHAHMDIGSFVLEANGVRWALDLGTENYNQMRAAKIDLWNTAQNSSRWDVFRNGSDGHNILRFHGASQDVDGKGEVQALILDNGDVGNLVDLSDVYKDQVENVKRHVTLHPDRSVTIEDHWIARAQSVDVAWQWLTRASVTQTEYGLLLQQQGQSLELIINCLLQFMVTIEDVSLPRNAPDSPNPGLSRIAIRLNTDPDHTGTLTVRAIPVKSP